MRFNPWTKERACGKSIATDEWYGNLACMRASGHGGECIALMCDAAKADGVKFCCRRPFKSDGHHPDCLRLLCPKILDDAGSICALKRGHAGPCDPGNNGEQ